MRNADFDEVGAVLNSSTLPPQPNNLAAGPYIFDEPVARDGMLFAFRADFYSTQPVHFQVYAPPINDGVVYTLKADIAFDPAVLSGREDVRTLLLACELISFHLHY